MSILDATASAAAAGDKQGLKDVLDFLVTEEALGVPFVTAAIQGTRGTPSEAFLPVLRNGVTQEYHHVEALKDAGGTQLTTRYWFPDAAFDNGGVGLSPPWRSSRRSRSASTCSRRGLARSQWPAAAMRSVLCSGGVREGVHRSKET